MNTYVDWAAIIASIIAGIGLILSAFQMARASRYQRVEQSAQLIKDLFDDTDLRTIYYKLEYGTFEYTDGFHESPEEQQLDKLLSRFDSLAKQVQMGIAKIKDLDLIAYEYLVIFQDQEVKAYLHFLDGWYQERGITKKPFQSFREVGRKLENHEYRGKRKGQLHQRGS